MSHPPRPDPPDLYVVQRVDCASPPTWFCGYGESWHTNVTQEFDKAVKMNLNDARTAVYSVGIDRGGVWGIRKV